MSIVLSMFSFFVKFLYDDCKQDSLFSCTNKLTPQRRAPLPPLLVPPLSLRTVDFERLAAVQVTVNDKVLLSMLFVL